MSAKVIMQPGSDWPGVFFGGQDALSTADHLRYVAARLPEEMRGERKLLTDLAQRFASCFVAEPEAKRWADVNGDGYEYLIGKGPFGDEFVKDEGGACVRRATDN